MNISFDDKISIIRVQFDTNKTQQKYLSDWMHLSIITEIHNNPGKTKAFCLKQLVKKIKKLMHLLPKLDKEKDKLQFSY